MGREGDREGERQKGRGKGGRDTRGWKRRVSLLKV